MTRPRAVVVGVGNPYRRDDGIGPGVVAAIERRVLPGVGVALCDGEPVSLLEAWTGTELAVVVDAVRCEPATPGRVHRTSADPWAHGGGSASSHGLGIPEALLLARALDRLPARLVVFAVEAADLDFGVGLSAPVAAALPGVISAVLTELRPFTSLPGQAGIPGAQSGLPDPEGERPASSARSRRRQVSARKRS